MGTAISRPSAALGACLAAALIGCGTSGSRTGATTSATPAAAASRGGSGEGGFSFLRPTPAPSSWREAKLADGATLFYPAGWRLTTGDEGTATAVTLDSRGDIAGYLNVTPQQGSETLADWTSFRVKHNIEEGEREVRREAAGSGLRFRTGRGTCVRDSYTTTTRARYVELACLVEGSATATVIVAAAPPREWSRVSSTLQRAIAALIT
jgi:hypothetical protein